ncbi:hypothetical protein SODALDRAFT_380227 [Sodiomyces alkalinus F11]|uniref:Uncharacterized protein n=1 Tax=Sodiomyces alkalinus (strain CBS 110278 / VKM F-3762 / F11) TaxID=1314773 RepID=A0A3N2PQE4_SODAK|nr:hypothetical protein SODALDRAFT_380227 [Sodiomyces alkalinus F11]ROT36722.1 hypothetical protein SODALDRAFT_380227 [Sodiomyces alkalinus F11]
MGRHGGIEVGICPRIPSPLSPQPDRWTFRNTTKAEEEGDVVGWKPDYFGNRPASWLRTLPGYRQVIHAPMSSTERGWLPSCPENRVTPRCVKHRDRRKRSRGLVWSHVRAKEKSCMENNTLQCGSANCSGLSLPRLFLFSHFCDHSNSPPAPAPSKPTSSPRCASPANGSPRELSCHFVPRLQPRPVTKLASDVLRKRKDSVPWYGNPRKTVKGKLQSDDCIGGPECDIVSGIGCTRHNDGLDMIYIDRVPCAWLSETRTNTKKYQTTNMDNNDGSISPSVHQSIVQSYCAGSGIIFTATVTAQATCKLLPRQSGHLGRAEDMGHGLLTAAPPLAPYPQ